MKTKSLISLVLAFLVVMPLIGKVLDSDGDPVKNDTISGTVTSTTTTGGGSLSSVVITTATGDTYTVTSDCDRVFMAGLGAAFDAGDTVSLETNSSGCIESLTRSKSMPIPF